MKIGLPKLRFSRKLLIITLGLTVLLGGTGVTALYFGGESLIMKGGENAVGGECTDVQTMIVKTPSNHLWLRKFIRMEDASGRDRIRTALRIAGILSKKNAVDLIHVSVLDTRGPTKRADMRARAIGAEVMIALKPDNLPEMKSPAMASYYEGPVSDEGRYYGDRVVMDINEIGSMMTAMRTVEEKPDCVSPVSETPAGAEKEGGKKKEKEAKKEGKKEKEGEKSAEESEKPGEAPEGKAKEGEEKVGEEAASDAPKAKEQSFLDSMLSMVGLGASEAASEETKPVSEESPESSAETKAAKSAEDSEEQPVANVRKTETSADPAAKRDDGSEAPEPVAEEPADLEQAPASVEATKDAGKNAAATDDLTSKKTEAPAEETEQTRSGESDEPVSATETTDGKAEAPADAARSSSKADGKDDSGKKKPEEQAQVEMPVGD